MFNRKARSGPSVAHITAARRVRQALLHRDEYPQGLAGDGAGADTPTECQTLDDDGVGDAVSTGRLQVRSSAVPVLRCELRPADLAGRCRPWRPAAGAVNSSVRLGNVVADMGFVPSFGSSDASGADDRHPSAACHRAPGRRRISQWPVPKALPIWRGRPAGGDLNNVAAPGQHLPDGQLRDTDEAAEVHTEGGVALALVVLGERLGDVEAAVVVTGCRCGRTAPSRPRRHARPWQGRPCRPGP
ncbi:hypothetical protein ABIA33_006985 [Streptacidiphilus sp. MAP12-16]